MGLFDSIGGSLIGSLGGPIGSIFGAGAGAGAIGSALGVDGAQKSYYQPGATPTQDMQGYNNLMSNVPNMNKDQASEALNPFTGSALASRQVQNDPTLGGLYGKGGQLEQAENEQTNLANTGYQMQPQDNTAYGQAAGNVARLYGGQEAGAANSLSSRGFGSSPSGVAGATFSGLQGNKNEMLAQAQTSIAQNRMQQNLDRLNSVRQYTQQLGQGAGNALQQQYGRNLAGVQEGSNQRFDAARVGLQGNQQANQLWGMKEGANQVSAENQQGREGKTLLQGLGGGLFNSAGQIGSIPGQLASKVAGGGGMGGLGGSSSGPGSFQSSPTSGQMDWNASSYADAQPQKPSPYKL